MKFLEAYQITRMEALKNRALSKIYMSDNEKMWKDEYERVASAIEMIAEIALSKELERKRGE